MVAFRRGLILVGLGMLGAACSANGGATDGPFDSGPRRDTGRDVGRDTGATSLPDGGTIDTGTPSDPDASGKDSGTDTGATTPTEDASTPPTDVPRECGATEVCDDGVDNNCNGTVDESCPCIPGTTRRCYDGPPERAGVGVCNWGTMRCEGPGEFGTWSACTGSGQPQPVVCGRGLDFRCNGRVDEGCTCAAGATRACYSGPSGTMGVGSCRAGTATCVMTESGSEWGPCAGEVLPAPDRCDNTDRDCDGNPLTGCTCIVGRTQPCYGGPAGTSGVGVCRAGTQTCVGGAGGRGSSWGACSGEVRPGTEVCSNSLDDNCNGTVDEGCTTGCAGGAPRCGATCCASGQTCVSGVCVGSGQLRITMTWDIRGDMDLHVVPPCGTLIYYAARTACGGQLDRDSCPAEVPSSSDDPCVGPENVYWATAPASGTYLVCAVPYQIPATTRFTVTVNQGTTVLRTWTGTRTGSNASARCTRTSPYFLGEFTL